MFRTLKPLAFVFGALVASTAVAQDATDPASSLSTGTPVGSAEPQVGQAYLKEKTGDWELRCLKTEDGNDPCQIYQLLLDENQSPVVEVNMFPLPETSQIPAGAMIVAPLGTLLNEGLTLSVDGGDARRYPFEFCNQGGCVARVGFTEAELAKFKAGNAATVRLAPANTAPGTEVVLNMSLTGFTAGFNQSTPPLN